MRLDDHFQYCHQLMKHHSKSFSYAFDYLPDRERRAVWAIYAVCRVIDDSIDVHHDPQYLQYIRQDIMAIEQQQLHPEFQSDARIMHAFSNVAHTFKMEYPAFYKLIDTVRKDQYFEQFDTDEAMLDYCYGVAGTVGEVLTPILAQQPTTETFRVARKLGEALQLTNILRDVGEDFEQGRIYISKERLAHFNIDIKQQYQQGVTSNYIKMWEALAYIAEQAYHDALSNIHVFNKQAQPIIELAAVIYASILDEVRKAGYTLHQRVYVSKVDKAKFYRRIKKKYQGQVE